MYMINYILYINIYTYILISIQAYEHEYGFRLTVDIKLHNI